MIIQLLEATRITLWIFLVTGLLSISLGLLLSVIQFNAPVWQKRIIHQYVLLMRGTPLLLQLIVVYFGLPYVGITFSREVAVIVAFTLNYGAYFNEIFRAGLESIDTGQFEAARVLHISKTKMYRKIIVPQAIKNVIPALSNEIITLVKDTSLVYVLGVSEVLRVGKMISNREATLLPLLYVGIIYLVLIAIVSRILNSWERKYAYYE